MRNAQVKIRVFHMTISMNGSWTINVKAKNAAWPQRFRIQGSTNGKDGYYNVTVSTSVFVTGTQWGLTVEHNPPGSAPWKRSRHRLADFKTAGGLFTFDICTDDSYADMDFNDSVLTCSMPLSSSEFIVYGSVKTYSKGCVFNPCYRPYLVIEDILQLKRALGYDRIKRIIESLYPERIKDFVKPPFPPPPPEPFRPIMIPSGIEDEPGYLVIGEAADRPVSIVEDQPTRVTRATATRRTTRAASARTREELVEATAATAVATARVVPYISKPQGYNMALSRVGEANLRELSRIADPIRWFPCTTKPMTETLLRFFEYDRTTEEKMGGSYTGEGNYNTLGMTATDEQGNYIFRFSMTSALTAEEAGDIAAGEAPATQILPDLIVHILTALPNEIAYESFPYYNIPNVKRLNICIPEWKIPNPSHPCQAGRALQSIGNIFIVPNPSSTLFADGTVNNTNPTGPLVSHAAWRGTLDVFGCFLDTNPAVARYTIKYRREGEADWHYVSEMYAHLRKQIDGTWASEVVGPTKTEELRVNGPANPKEKVESYMNIETNTEWIYTHRNRKIQLHTSVYQPVAGAVEYKIEGFDASGERVPGAEDAVKLYIDNHQATGRVDWIKLDGFAPGECGLFHIPASNSPLTIRFSAMDIEGFLDSYALNVYWGSNNNLPVTQDPPTAHPIAENYTPNPPYRFYGTWAILNPDGYVEVNVKPTGANPWLPTGKTFCAFSFELSARDRVTDGYNIPSSFTLWRELIGITTT